MSAVSAIITTYVSAYLFDILKRSKIIEVIEVCSCFLNNSFEEFGTDEKVWQTWSGKKLSPGRLRDH